MCIEWNSKTKEKLPSIRLDVTKFGVIVLYVKYILLSISKLIIKLSSYYSTASFKAKILIRKKLNYNLVHEGPMPRLNAFYTLWTFPDFHSIPFSIYSEIKLLLLPTIVLTIDFPLNTLSSSFVYSKPCLGHNKCSIIGG
jgi:hypothetical protein